MLIKTFCRFSIEYWISFLWIRNHKTLHFSREQTSADKDSESPDSSVLSLSGRTYRQRTEFFWKSGQNPDTGQNRDRQNPDRQTSDRIFYKIPDRIRTADRIETDRIRTDRHRTENPDRIRTADRHRTRFSGKSGQKRDTDRTRTVLSADVCLEQSSQAMVTSGSFVEVLKK